MDSSVLGALIGGGIGIAVAWSTIFVFLTWWYKRKKTS